jgi:transposase
VDFVAGSRFAVPDENGTHPVHDTVEKNYRHLNFFQHECHLQVRVPRVKLPSGAVRQVKPEWVGKLAGFTLLFEALVLALCREMPFSAVARLTHLSVHRVMAICTRHVEAAVSQADHSAVRQLAIDETSRAKGHDYVTLAADAERRAVIFVAEGRDAATIEGVAGNLRLHRGRPRQIEAVSIDMSPAYIKGVGEQFGNAQITFDKFHVIAHASKAIDLTRRLEQKRDPQLKGLRWALLKDRRDVGRTQRAELDALLARMTTRRTARAWHYREQWREILSRKQVHVVRALLKQWCTNVMRSKVEPMKEVAQLIRNHFDGVLAWVKSRQTNGFVEAVNGLFQAAKRKARGYRHFRTIRAVIFLIAGKLDFSTLNPYVTQPT